MPRTSCQALSIGCLWMIAAGLGCADHDRVLKPPPEVDPWQVLPGLDELDDYVEAVEWSDEGLLVGGGFERVGKIAAPGLALWTGDSWQTLDGWNPGGAEHVLDIQWTRELGVVVAGAFRNAGQRSVTVLKDGQNVDLGGGLFGGSQEYCTAVLVDGGRIFAAGVFDTAGTARCQNVALWDGNKWNALGLGVGDIYAGEVLPSLDVARWRGEWIVSRVGPEFNPGILRFTGTDWVGLPNPAGSCDDVFRILPLGESLIACGRFDTGTSGSLRNVARFDGLAWSALGDGVDGSIVDAACVGDSLIVGGHFSHAGSVDANSLALWDGARWQAIGGTLLSSSQVLSVAVGDGGLAIAGQLEFEDGRHGGVAILEGWPAAD
jgi:hypothetical protein